MKQKFAFFDFDDTLIHGDSGKALLKYYIKNILWLFLDC